MTSTKDGENNVNASGRFNDDAIDKLFEDPNCLDNWRHRTHGLLFTLEPQEGKGKPQVAFIIEVEGSTADGQLKRVVLPMTGARLDALIDTLTRARTSMHTDRVMKQISNVFNRRRK